MRCWKPLRMKHLTHCMDDNSVAAFRAEETKLTRRAQAIVDHLTPRGPRTDREIAREMGFGENLNAVRPRVTELLDLHKLMKVGDVRCPVTGKTVRRVDIRRPRQGVLLS